MYRYDRGWDRGYFPAPRVRYDRLFRRGRARWAPYDRGWHRYDEDLYERPGRGAEYPLYGGDYSRRGAYDYPTRWSGPAGWEAYGPASLDRPRYQRSARWGYPGSSWRRRSGEDGWEWPRAYADDDIEGFFDEEDEEDPDEFSAFDDPYLVDEWEDAPDEEVHEAVLLSLASDGFLDARNIRVEVRDRVVTLRGEVGDYMEARYAWDDAWDAPGVRGVISKLSVAEPGGQEASKVSGTPEAAPVAPTKTLRSTGTGKAAQE